MKKTEKLTVKFRDKIVGTLSHTPENRLNVFEYDRHWLAEGFSVSPLELPLKPGAFIAWKRRVRLTPSGTRDLTPLGKI